MKAAVLGLEEVTPDDVVLVGWEGEVLSGSGRRHAEYPIHAEVAAAPGDVGCVIHTLARRGRPRRPMRAAAARLARGEPVRLARSPAVRPDRGPDPGGRAGRAVAEALDDRNTCLLVNHDEVVAAADVQTATVTTYLLDRACRTQLAAMSAGGWASWSSPVESLAKRGYCYPDPLLEGAWEYLVRRLKRT
jgi:ribulose-5-phosphate 4-epimerase/fuculose-1-phosphate aldolase